MARPQTVFSELCVAMAIANTNNVTEIKNVTTDDAQIYEAELIARQTSKLSSINTLQAAGTAVRRFLERQGITPKTTIWTGKTKLSAVVNVAKDIEVANYRVSVKENANVFINGSPITVFEDVPMGVFGQKRKGTDWFLKTAPNELQLYFECCSAALNANIDLTVDEFYKKTSKIDRKKFTTEVAILHKTNQEVLKAYAALCLRVSEESARIFNANLTTFRSNNKSPKAFDPIFHFFFKINGVTYILAGSEKNKPFAVLLDSSSEWIEKYQFIDILAVPKPAGQPEVALKFKFKNKLTKEEYTCELKVEVRWSHGKFCGNPEAKVYKQWSYSDLPWSTNLFIDDAE